MIDWCLTPTLAILKLYCGVGTKKKWPYKTKRFNSNKIVYDRTRKGLHFNTGDCLIEVTLSAGLTVYIYKLSIFILFLSNELCYFELDFTPLEDQHKLKLIKF